MLGRVGRYARNSLAAVGLATVGSVYLVTTAQKRMRKNATTLPDQFVLELDLETQELVESAAFDPLVLLGQAPKKLQVRKVVRALIEAADDKRVCGLVAYVGDSTASAGLAITQELRAAVQDFRRKSAGRAACIAYSDSFGEAGSLGTAGYYLASAFEKVVVQPTGMVSLTGLAAQGTFVRKLLDKWSIKQQFIAREEYKSAVERLTAEKFSEPSRRAMDRLLTSMTDSIAEDIAHSRGLRKQDVEAAINEAPLFAQRAVDLKLLDAVQYRDEALAEAGARVDTRGKAKPKRIPLTRYLSVIEAKEAQRKGRDQLAGVLRALSDGKDADEAAGGKGGTPEVAVLIAEGPIYVGTPSQSTPGQSTTIIDSIKLCKTLRELRDNKTVKAIVVRVNSPGGSAVASDTIHREMSNLRTAGKPVVVSMGNYAASGGYYISAPATRIVAQPTTITGSIGVIYGKLNIAGGLGQVGITTDIIACGRNAAATSPFTDFTKEQLVQAEAMTDSIYRFFMQRVSEGRGLSAEATRAIAKGRVWSGADALQHGLVDKLGGLQDAIALARQEAGLSEEDSEVVDYPKPKQPVELLRSVMRGEPIEASMGSNLGGGSLAGALGTPFSAAALLGGLLAGADGGAGCTAAAAAVLAAGGGGGGGGVAACAQQAAAAGQAGPQLVCNVSVH